jgi:hypothetical protein
MNSARDRRNMTRRVVVVALGATSLGLRGVAAGAQSAPGPADKSVPPPGLDAKAMYQQFRENGKGFDMRPGGRGALTVYIAFDPQCPDGVQLWRALQPIADRLRFVWLPVAVLNPRSEPQGAAILSAPDPLAMMERHLATFETASRGLDVEGLVVPMTAREQVWVNSRIFRRTGGRSVPYAVFQSSQGQFGVIPEPLATDELLRILGLPA